MIDVKAILLKSPAMIVTLCIGSISALVVVHLDVIIFREKGFLVTKISKDLHHLLVLLCPVSLPWSFFQGPCLSYPRGHCKGLGKKIPTAVAIRLAAQRAMASPVTVKTSALGDVPLLFFPSNAS